MSNFVHSIYLWLTSIDPALPWLLLTTIVFGLVLASRKFLPALWVAFDTVTPDGALGHFLQGVPSVMLGAILSALMSGGDVTKTVKGAIAGAAAPVVHLLAKKYQGEVDLSKLIAKAAGIVLVLLVLLVTGCHGTLQGSHITVGTSPELSRRCQSLSNIHRDYGGIAEGAAFGAGAAGIAIIPTHDASGEMVEAVAAAVLGIASAGAGFVAHDAAVSYAEECR